MWLVSDSWAVSQALIFSSVSSRDKYGTVSPNRRHTSSQKNVCLIISIHTSEREEQTTHHFSGTSFRFSDITRDAHRGNDQAITVLLTFCTLSLSLSELKWWRFTYRYHPQYVVSYGKSLSNTKVFIILLCSFGCRCVSRNPRVLHGCSRNPSIIVSLQKRSPTGVRFPEHFKFGAHWYWCRIYLSYLR